MNSATSIHFCTHVTFVVQSSRFIVNGAQSWRKVLVEAEEVERWEESYSGTLNTKSRFLIQQLHYDRGPEKLGRFKASLIKDVCLEHVSRVFFLPRQVDHRFVCLIGNFSVESDWNWTTFCGANEGRGIINLGIILCRIVRCDSPRIATALFTLFHES